jgi:hypothetical protein
VSGDAAVGPGVSRHDWNEPRDQWSKSALGGGTDVLMKVYPLPKSSWAGAKSLGERRRTALTRSQAPLPTALWDRVQCQRLEQEKPFSHGQALGILGLLVDDASNFFNVNPETLQNGLQQLYRRFNWVLENDEAFARVTDHSRPHLDSQELRDLNDKLDRHRVFAAIRLTRGVVVGLVGHRFAMNLLDVVGDMLGNPNSTVVGDVLQSDDWNAVAAEGSGIITFGTRRVYAGDDAKHMVALQHVLREVGQLTAKETPTALVDAFNKWTDVFIKRADVEWEAARGGEWKERPLPDHLMQLKLFRENTARDFHTFVTRANPSSAAEHMSIAVADMYRDCDFERRRTKADDDRTVSEGSSGRARTADELDDDLWLGIRELSKVSVGSLMRNAVNARFEFGDRYSAEGSRKRMLRVIRATDGTRSLGIPAGVKPSATFAQAGHCAGQAVVTPFTADVSRTLRVHRLCEQRFGGTIPLIERDVVKIDGTKVSGGQKRRWNFSNVEAIGLLSLCVADALARKDELSLTDAENEQWRGKVPPVPADAFPATPTFRADRSITQGIEPSCPYPHLD